MTTISSLFFLPCPSAQPHFLALLNPHKTSLITGIDIQVIFVAEEKKNLFFLHCSLKFHIKGMTCSCDQHATASGSQLQQFHTCALRLTNCHNSHANLPVSSAMPFFYAYFSLPHHTLLKQAGNHRHFATENCFIGCFSSAYVSNEFTSRWGKS